LVGGLVLGMPTRRTNNFPWKWAWPRSRDLQFLAYDRTYLQNYLSYRLQIWYTALYGQCRAGAQIIFPKCWRGLGHVTPTIFGIRWNISLKHIELETSNLIHGVWGMPSGRTNNFP